MINPQNRNFAELNTRFFSSFDRLPHRVSHINFNLYHYAGNNPVKYIDPDGLAAWDSTNEWSQDYIDEYSCYVSNKIEEYSESGEKFTCEDLALSLLIDFASEHNLPVTIINESGTFSSDGKEFSSVDQFKNKVLSSTAASDIELNTIMIDLTEATSGDLICMDTGVPNGTKDDKYSHIQVITGKLGNFFSISQGNISGGSSKYNSSLYGGELIQSRIYDWNKDIFKNKIQNTSVPDASNSFGMSFRRWNFYEM